VHLAKQSLGSGMIRISVKFDRFRSASRIHNNIGLLLTITVSLDHATVSAPTIRHSLGDIMERQQLFLLIIVITLIINKQINNISH